MKNRQLNNISGIFAFIFTLLLGMSVSVQSVPSQLLNEPYNKADWFFSGRVHNENNLYYDYFFKIQQHDQMTDLEAVLVSVADQQVILFEHATQRSITPKQNTWQTEKLFLSYNPISNRWILNARNDEGVNFNFKIDMLAQKPFGISKKLPFQSELQLEMNKTGRLNGHIRLGQGKEEEFISENSAWFSHSRSKASDLSATMTLLICDFEDEQGFFTMTSKNQKLPYSFSYWYNAEGKSVPVSQFVHTENLGDALTIRATLPKIHLRVGNFLSKMNETHSVAILGSVSGYPSAGFCVQHDMG